MRLSFGLPLLALLAACSNTNGSGAAAKINPNDHVNAASIGEFKVIQEAPLGQYGEPTLTLPDQNKCSGNTQVYDVRLAPGEQFVEFQQSATDDHYSSVKITTQIQEVSASVLKSGMTYSEIQFYPNANIPQQLEATLTCTLSQNGSNCDQQFVNFDASKMPQTKYCNESSTSSASQIEGKSQLGTYRMSNGQTVRAQRIVSLKKNADLACSVGDSAETAAGHGTVQEETISTIDLVVTSPTSCTPVSRVYHKRTITLDDGTVLQSEQNEILAAPQR